MSTDSIVMGGIVKPDGTLELEGKVPLPAGRVSVTLQAVPYAQETDPAGIPDTDISQITGRKPGAGGGGLLSCCACFARLSASFIKLIRKFVLPIRARPDSPGGSQFFRIEQQIQPGVPYHKPR